eukprot:CAMPEP_0202967650 /NCGR_PEP_ID=MMETSP1396-20130829/12608_1 /ASSEMBLY_ACC=CAM_ASM_000872 /TAXON_ID= /ORGANISM="Pseudokeronopsis sp., Strain Brazil" /LENGTH=85 /DNA_ID=CAMNT_0049692959 /DNA_START=12 /DNA_END=266 /DNA_ORIENTATION=+
MKQTLSILLLSALLLFAVNAKNKCKINFYEEDYDNWYAFATAYAFGMQVEPDENPDECRKCTKLGTKVADLNPGFIYLMNKASDW